MWITHSSDSGPQRSGPIGTITTLTPVCGHSSQRISTSGSCAQRREVRADVQRRGLGQHAQTLVLHADLARDTSPAVSADQVSRADRVLAPGVVIADLGA